jgi:hypothetical protein
VVVSLAAGARGRCGARGAAGLSREGLYGAQEANSPGPAVSDAWEDSFVGGRWWFGGVVVVKGVKPDVAWSVVTRLVRILWYSNTPARKSDAASPTPKTGRSV